MIIDRLDEEFLLFALHQDGTWVSRRHGSVKYGLAAAWILELLREGRVRQTGKKIVPRGRSLVDDEALDMVLGLIHRAKRPRTVTWWLHVLAKRVPRTVPALARRLRGRGYVDIVQDAKGVERYPMHRSEARQEIRAHLQEVMAGNQERDLVSIDLLCVLGASGMTEEVFGKGRRVAAEQRILEMIQYDPHLLYIWKAVRGVRRWGRFAWPPRYEVPAVHFKDVSTA